MSEPTKKSARRAGRSRRLVVGITGIVAAAALSAGVAASAEAATAPQAASVGVVVGGPSTGPVMNLLGVRWQ